MRTRNADNPKSPTPAKKTPPGRKTAAKTPPPPSDASTESPSEPTITPKRASSTRGKAMATKDATEATPVTPVTPVKATKVEDEHVKVTPKTKSGARKTVRKVVRRTVIRKKPKINSESVSLAVQKDDNEVPTRTEILKEVKQEEHDDDDKNVAEAEHSMKNVEESIEVHPALEEEEDPEEDPEEENVETDEKTLEENMETEEKSLEENKKEESQVQKPDQNQETTMEKEKDIEIEEDPSEIDEDKEFENDEQKEINKEHKEEEDPQERVCLSDEEKDKDICNDPQEDDGDDVADAKVAEEEQAEFTAAAEDRKRRKEFEIFVGGLDRETTEEEVKRVFQNAGEVVDVRLHKEISAYKNKGYAFVRFASKEHVARALSEMKNPVIHGKRCGTAPSEDNDTLFLGNICNTWTKEAIRQKLKDYGIEHVERITLVPDAQHEGLSRGFAFLEFSGHPDAMLAYKRLQKSDALFGHPDRTAKVAFAEPLREPDPEVLAQVKSVFVDGLPPHWDEDTVREHLKGFGTIERIMLARNMSTAKRKDFGFIDFATHEAAVACIDGINQRELGDEKLKVRARLSNPVKKTQAVKGGIAGGFRIGHGSGPTFPRPGRGFGRGPHPPNHMNFQRGGRGFYQHGPGQSQSQTSRMGFDHDYLPASSHHPFMGRHDCGRGRWDDFKGPHQQYGYDTMPHRYDMDRPTHGGVMDHNHYPTPPMRGHPYFHEDEFYRPYGGRRYDDPYGYGDPARGVKRPYYPEQDRDYIEPSRGRPRFDYSDPAYSVPGNHFRGGGSGGHSRDYYNDNYADPYSSYYGGDRSYGGDRPCGRGYNY